MTNIKTETKGKQMIITINLEEEHGSTSTGKRTVVASSHGYQPIAEGVTMNMLVLKQK